MRSMWGKSLSAILNANVFKNTLLKWAIEIHVIYFSTLNRLRLFLLTPWHTIYVSNLVSGSLCALPLSVSLLISPVTISFCRRKSTRLTAVLGGLVTSLGCLFASFAIQFHQLVLSYGILLGNLSTNRLAGNCILPLLRSWCWSNKRYINTNGWTVFQEEERTSWDSTYVRKWTWYICYDAHPQGLHQRNWLAAWSTSCNSSDILNFHPG